MLRHDTGVLEAPVGGGKTVMSMSQVARRRQPTLFIVHTRELAQQAIDTAVKVLGMSPEEIGARRSSVRSVSRKATPSRSSRVCCRAAGRALSALQVLAVEADFQVLEHLRAEAARRRDDARPPMETAIALQRQAEQAAGAAISTFNAADREEQDLALRINNVQLQLAEMEKQAAGQSWRP